VRVLPTTAACLAALAAASCGGGDKSALLEPAKVRAILGKPGSEWQRLSGGERRDALATCRLERAVDLARGEGATQAPYFSSRYTAVMRLRAEELREALRRRFAKPEFRREPIGSGCRAVIDKHVDLPALLSRPYADFASPVAVRRGVLTLDVAGDRTVLRARVAPAGARLRIEHAPGRARTTARWTITHRGAEAIVRLRGIPRGISYLQARVGSWRRTIVVRGTRAPVLPAPRAFAPIRLRGRGEVGLPTLYVPRPATLLASAEGAPIAVTTGHTLLAAVSGKPGDRIVPLRPGHYRDVRVRSPGRWSLLIRER
jgi:hypothetical protein